MACLLIAQALATLGMDADELALVRLRLNQGCTYGEIADELGVGREAVKWQARLIRQKEQQ